MTVNPIGLSLPGITCLTDGNFKLMIVKDPECYLLFLVSGNENTSLEKDPELTLNPQYP